MIKYTDPLDYLTESANPLFGEGSVGEVTLPGDFESELPEFPMEPEDEAGETPEHEAGESEDEETTEELDTLSKELKDLKNKITELKTKYPEDTNGEVASALDDATSAIDLAVHHLDDIEEDLSKPEAEATPEVEDQTMPGGEGGGIDPEPDDSSLDLEEEDWNV
ncbi:MAG: hypothetical protein JHC33_01065 [Ignisphaera sp.]|nr:hypothetical protein [Ignisphaera sp.]